MTRLMNVLSEAKNFDLNEETLEIIYNYIKQREESQYEENFIDIKYTEDECGKLAEELGIIEHAYPGDAGIDLPIVFENKGSYTINPDERELLRTGMVTAFPEGYWGFIIHRSSTERTYKLRIVEGVIDEYRGELLIQIHNTSDKPVTINHGQRLAQLILIKTASFKARVVNVLRPSHRHDRGFGSSGA